MDLPEDVKDFVKNLAGELVLSQEPGGQIRTLRDRYGFTQEWLANHVDVRRESLSRIEGNRVQPSTAFLASFSRIMGLAFAVRSHLARREATHESPDYLYLSRVAQALSLAREAADDVILASVKNYGDKRRHVITEMERST